MQIGSYGESNRLKAAAFQTERACYAAAFDLTYVIIRSDYGLIQKNSLRINPPITPITIDIKILSRAKFRVKLKHVNSNNKSATVTTPWK